MKRKQSLATGSIYHILNKSIAGYEIFSSPKDYERLLLAIRFFNLEDPLLPRFSRFLDKASSQNKNPTEILNKRTNNAQKKMRILAYSIMPTHFHFVVEQLQDKGVSTTMGNACNAYARYFNAKNKRKGRLWQDKFKNVLVHTNEQLLHLTRYVHLNPVSAGLVKMPEDWVYSSYLEYIAPEKVKHPLCEFKDLIDTPFFSYKEFVEDRADYQQKISKIKGLILE